MLSRLHKGIGEAQGRLLQPLDSAFGKAAIDPQWVSTAVFPQDFMDTYIWISIIFTCLEIVLSFENVAIVHGLYESGVDWIWPTGWKKMRQVFKNQYLPDSCQERFCSWATDTAHCLHSTLLFLGFLLFGVCLSGSCFVMCSHLP